MRNILSRPHIAVLEELLWSNVLLAFDFDGTLAPIVGDPTQAFMRAGTKQLLSRVAALYPVVVISGRARSDLTIRLRGVSAKRLIGNHGSEVVNSRRHVDEVRAWKERLDRTMKPFVGVEVEDKKHSLAVHYRHCRAKKAARNAAIRVTSTLENVRLIPGKQVINIVPSDAPHKGMALEQERKRLGCDTALYVGDDATDEDVFSLDQPGQLLSIRVGRKVHSAARYFIPSQRSIDSLLRALLECTPLKRGRIAAR